MKIEYYHSKGPSEKSYLPFQQRYSKWATKKHSSWGLGGGDGNTARSRTLTYSRWEGTTTTEALPQEPGVQTPHWTPQPGCLHQEDQPPQCLALRLMGCLSRRARGQEETKTLLLKGVHSLTLKFSTEAAAWKAPGVYRKKAHWLILGCVPERQGSVGKFSRDGSTGRHHIFFFLALLPSWSSTRQGSSISDTVPSAVLAPLTESRISLVNMHSPTKPPRTPCEWLSDPSRHQSPSQAPPPCRSVPQHWVSTAVTDAYAV